LNLIDNLLCFVGYGKSRLLDGNPTAHGHAGAISPVAMMR